MADVYVYVVRLPGNIREMVVPCADDAYTIYISDRLDDEQRKEAYQHALLHIRNNDFEKFDVQEIEAEAHEGG